MVNYTTRPDDFAAESIKVFDEALHSIGDITKLQSRL